MTAEKLLQILEERGSIHDSKELADEWGMEHQQVVGFMKSLEARYMVESYIQERHIWQVSEEGQLLAKHGSHEARVFGLVQKYPEVGVELPTLEEQLSSAMAKIGLGKAIKRKWVTTREGKVFPLVTEIYDETCGLLNEILQHPTAPQVTDTELKELRMRKLVEQHLVKTYRIEKGPEFSLTPKELATDMTSEMLIDHAWKHHTFKKYNFESRGMSPQGGHLHPLLKVREQFRQIFFEMGFTEMPTNNFIESSFWNFDALFQPQQHPARDLHDTFFIGDPAMATDLPMDYVERVRQVHENGGYGSIGYGYEWKIDEARKNVLRTHTTAVSARMLYALAQRSPFQAAKYFSIDRVYRNENVDATHLAEFHQIEGVIVDYGLTLADLIGTLTEFFKKLGMTRLKFKPAYNPYTEPSLEVFGYHTGLGRWIEVGNSGMFRPEMLEPMGFSKEVVAIAWGLSLERPTMIKYGISNIRDLLGHKVDLRTIQTHPICRFDNTEIPT